MADNNQVLQALGYPMLALPQTIKPVTNTKTTVQRTEYAPEKLQALMTALQTPSLKKNGWESVANALANTPEARSFTGAYGTEVINPWAVGLSSLARGFGGAYSDRKEAEREAATQDRENAIKAAQLALDADKQVVTNEVADEWMKYNLDPNAKVAQDQALAQQKLAQTAYVKLNPKLGDEFRSNPKSFDYIAREADIGGRTPAGGTTGMGERLVSAIMKDRAGDEALKKRGELLQEATQYVTAITDLAKQGGATGQMMNSDKEGQRAMAMFANPASYSAEELGAAADSLVNLYNRMLAVQGLPSVEEGYNQVSQMVEARKPKAQETDPWAKYRTK